MYVKYLTSVKTTKKKQILLPLGKIKRALNVATRRRNCVVFLVNELHNKNAIYVQRATSYIVDHPDIRLFNDILSRSNNSRSTLLQASR